MQAPGSFSLFRFLAVLAAWACAGASARAEAVPSMREAGVGFVVSTEAGGAWGEAGFMAFDDVFREGRLGLPASHGPVRLRLLKRGPGPGHIDLARVDGRGATAVRNATDERPLSLLRDKDFDVLHVPEPPGVLELTFPGGGELLLAARVEGERSVEEPFRFPAANLHRPMTPDRSFYRCDPGPEPRLLFAEGTSPGTGHPWGMTAATAWQECGRLRVRLDFQADNTLDGERDYASLHLRGNGEVKTYTITAADRRWGEPLFAYTPAVPWRHKVYEFDLPLEEPALEPGRPLELAFSAYGTAGPGPYDPAVAYGEQNREYLASYYYAYADGHSRIQTRRYTPAGAQSGGVLDVTVKDAASKTECAVARDSSNDRFLVLWVQPENKVSLVHRQLVTSANALYGWVEAAVSSEDQRYPAAAFSPTSNRFLTVWQQGDKSDIFGSMVNTDNSAYGTAVDICSADESQQRPAVDLRTQDNNFIVAWSDTRTTANLSDVYGALVSAEGVRLGVPTSIYAGAGGQYNVDVAYDPDSPDGRVLVVWQDTRDEGTTEDDIYGRFVAMGLVVTGDDFPIAAGAGEQWGPRVVYAGGGRYLVVWEDRSFSPARICGRYVGSTGALVGGPRCFGRDSGVSGPDLAGDGKGGALVLFMYMDGLDVAIGAEPYRFFGFAPLWPLLSTYAQDQRRFLLWRSNSPNLQALLPPAS